MTLALLFFKKVLNFFVVRILVFHSGLKWFQNVNKQNFCKKIWMKKHTQWCCAAPLAQAEKGTLVGKKANQAPLAPPAQHTGRNDPNCVQKLWSQKLFDFVSQMIFELFSKTSASLMLAFPSIGFPSIRALRDHSSITSSCF